MKILHILFDDYPFVQDWGYQENKFCNYQILKNDVTIVAGRYIPKVLSENIKLENLVEYEVKEYTNTTLKIYRLNCLFGNTFMGKKTKYYLGLKHILCIEKPDAIFIHDLHALSLYSVSNYLKNNCNVICNADIHVNYVNSCKNFLSICLHGLIYRFIIQQNIKEISKIYYFNDNSKKFISSLYGITESNCKLEFLPLGGDIIDIELKKQLQEEYIKKYKLNKDSIIFIHSGKMNRLKMTLEIIEEFSKIKDNRFQLLLIGTPSKEIENTFFKLIDMDNRIYFLGWKSNEELMYYLKIGDVYLQPGSPSVTAHEAMCKGCATILSDKGDFYKQFIKNDCAIYVRNQMDLYNTFKKIKLHSSFLNSYKINGYNLAKKIFNYKEQSENTLK